MQLVNWEKAKYWTRQANMWIGCHPVSPACKNCWAKAWSDRFNQSFEPHRSNKKTMPRKGVVFVGNLSDMFGEFVPKDESIDYVCQAAQYAHQATYVWCTKRPKRMVEALNGKVGDNLSVSDFNVKSQFFGFTAENQDWYDRRFAELADRPPWMKWWVSAEPLLGPIDFHFFVRDEVTGEMCIDGSKVPHLVIVGCESGPNRRPCKLEWVESIVEQCRLAGTLCFVKQLDAGGRCETDVNKFPEHLRVRQLPEKWAQNLKEDSRGR